MRIPSFQVMRRRQGNDPALLANRTIEMIGHTLVFQNPRLVSVSGTNGVGLDSQGRHPQAASECHQTMKQTDKSG